VFGGEAVPWEELKKAEKGRASVFDGIPASLPGLLYALKVIGKAESVGVSITDGDDLGDELLALVARSREAGIDPEAALRAAASRLEAAARAAESQE
jgi:XTP/dITP diphosphohydrolase